MKTYFRFRVQDLLFLTLVCAIGLAWWSDHQKLTSKYPRYWEINRRTNYANSVLTHFQGHNDWKSNQIIQQSLRFNGGGRSIPTEDATQAGRTDLIFRTENETIQREVLKTLTKICEDMEIFVGPQSVIISGDESLLASQEGWLRLKVFWPADDARRTYPKDDMPAIRPLAIEYQLSFTPQVKPTSQQDLKRLGVNFSSKPTSPAK